MIIFLVFILAEKNNSFTSKKKKTQKEKKKSKHRIQLLIQWSGNKSDLNPFKWNVNTFSIYFFFLFDIPKYLCWIIDEAAKWAMKRNEISLVTIWKLSWIPMGSDQYLNNFSGPKQKINKLSTSPTFGIFWMNLIRNLDQNFNSRFHFHFIEKKKIILSTHQKYFFLSPLKRKRKISVLIHPRITFLSTRT